MSVWKQKKRYKRKTKYGIQWVKPHKQRYTTQEETTVELITNTLEKDRLFGTQVANQFNIEISKSKRKKRKKKVRNNE